MLLLLSSSGCSKSVSEGGDNGSGALVRIVPRTVRATALNFEPGDRIGLSIERTAGPYAVNTPLTYDGTVFSGTLQWYSDSDDAAALRAYYPYDAAGFPHTFEVASDQRAGYASSDLLGAVEEEVAPAATPVAMLFRHLMSRLYIFIEDAAGHEARSVVLNGFITRAQIDAGTLAATAAEGAAVQNVYACEDAANRYIAILVPQQGDLNIRITMDDATTYEKTFSQVTLLGGYDYDLNIRTSENGLQVSLSGQIVDWVDGGTLETGDDLQPDGTLQYAGERYRTQQIAGRCWMAENLRYIPAEAVYGQDYWYPAGEAENVARQGVLYNYFTATKSEYSSDTKNTDANNAAAATAAIGSNSERCRTIGCSKTAVASSTDSRSAIVVGICPAGWHIPSSEELQELIDNAPGADFFCCAGYYIVEETIQKFASPGQGILLGTTFTDEAKVYALRIAQPLYAPALI
ncbi:MAG: fimbrillin family protein, partial [Alistipes sp.]|nr:fimbrillin family protein [Alistipes sp.]